MSMNAKIEVKNRAIELYKSGLSANQISKEILYNEATIRKWLKDSGLVLKSGGSFNKKYTDEQIENIKKLYNQGKNTTEIDEQLKLRRGASQYILSKQDIELRHRGPTSCIKREDYFDVIDSEDKAYFLGYIMADGNVSVHSGQYSLKFHISIQDREIVDNFIRIIESSNKVTSREETKSYYTSLTSVHMCKSLINHGVIPNKTSHEIIPKTVPANLINHFLRGLFDGDGITDISKKRSGFVGSKYIIDDILNLLDENLTVFKAGKNQKVVYFLGGKKFSRKLYSYLYKDATIWLDRKKTRLEFICSK